jgi:urease accessory protein
MKCDYAFEMNAPFKQSSIRAIDSDETDLPAYVRANGVLRLSVSAHSKHGLQRDVHEEGTARLRFPRRHSGPLQAIMMNIAGGVAGGDLFSTDILVQKKAELAVSTPSAERIYRAAGAAAQFDIKLRIDDGASLLWHPQETILFNGAKLNRTIAVDCSPSATFVMAEMLVLGRRESGESFTTGDLRDHWNIRLNNRLVMAERLHLNSAALQEATPARFGTAHAFTTLVIAQAEGMDKLEHYREILKQSDSADVLTAATAYSGLVVIRLRSGIAGALKVTTSRFLAAAFPRLVPRSF